MDTPEQLAHRARRSYETGRVRQAFAAVLPLVPLLGLLYAVGHRPTVLVLGVPLIALCVGLWVRGRGLQHAVRPGLLGGALPIAAAVVTIQCASESAACGHWCFVSCASAGIVVGAWLSVAVVRRFPAKVSVAAVTIAATTSALGCLPIGLGTLLGAVAGLLAGLAPGLLVRPAQS